MEPSGRCKLDVAWIVVSLPILLLALASLRVESGCCMLHPPYGRICAPTRPLESVIRVAPILIPAPQCARELEGGQRCS